MSETKNVLFLCTHNSARSILSEAILNSKGKGRFRAYSAGSAPKTAPNPDGLALLRERGHDTDYLTSKSWDVFAEPGAPALDIIITVCDNAGGEVCPIWPGHPLTAHWGIEDPSAGAPDKRKAAFAEAYSQLEARIDALLALPDTLSGGELKRALNRIGAEGAGATEIAKGGLSS